MAPDAYARVTVLAPRRRVDVALPADVPVGELVPMVLELIGEPAGAHRPRPWRMTGVTGGRLHPNATLDELGVLDGELLRIGPADAPPPPPVFDDPVDAVASTAGRARAPARRPAAVVALVLAAASSAVLASVAGAWAVGAAAVGLLTAAAALTRAALLMRAGNRAGAGTAALVAVLPAAAAGALAASGLPGPPQLLVAAAAAGAAAAVGQVVLRVAEPVLIAVVAVAVPVAVALVLHLRLGVGLGALAAGIGALALVAGPLLPRAALRLAGLPRPVVPADAGELTDADDDPLPPDELAQRAELARGYLGGMVGGAAVLAAAAVLPTAATGGWAGPALAAVIVVVLALRARGFADPAPARTLLAGAVVAGIGLAGLTALTADPPMRLLVAALLVLATVGAVAAERSTPVLSPIARRAVDLVEGVLVAVAVPLALGAMGLYALVRGL